MAGLVEHLKVATDSHKSLVNVIKILQEWNKTVSHFRTGKDYLDRPYLILMWSEDSQKKCQPLIAPMDNPEAIADQIYAWLKTQEYGSEPDHDGSNHMGWIATNRGPITSRKPNQYHRPELEHSQYWSNTYDTSFYDVICIQPYWVEYGK